jgi:hypothetical protein
LLSFISDFVVKQHGATHSILHYAHGDYFAAPQGFGRASGDDLPNPSNAEPNFYVQLDEKGKVNSKNLFRAKLNKTILYH